MKTLVNIFVGLIAIITFLVIIHYTGVLVTDYIPARGELWRENATAFNRFFCYCYYGFFTWFCAISLGGMAYGIGRFVIEAIKTKK